jgi:hypothetical protein
MTLLFLDGFDANDAEVKWTSNLSAAPSYAEATRDGVGSAFVATTTTGRIRKTITASAGVICGFAFKPKSLTTSVSIVSFAADAGVTQHHILQTAASGALRAQRSASVLATSAAGVIVLNTWCYVEVRGTLNDTTGAFEVRVNGVPVINFTGDTKNAGTSTNIDQVIVGGGTFTSPNFVYDDVYILNTSGSVNNTFLGDVRVRTVFPDGAGASTQFTPTGSGSNWQNVDETPYSTTDYNSSTTSGHRDTYTLGAISAGDTVHGIQTNMVAKKGGGDPDMKTVVRSGGTNYSDATSTVTTTAATYSTVRESDPATTAAWTVSGVNGLEAGVEIA